MQIAVNFQVQVNATSCHSKFEIHHFMTEQLFNALKAIETLASDTMDCPRTRAWRETYHTIRLLLIKYITPISNWRSILFSFQHYFTENRKFISYYMKSYHQTESECNPVLNILNFGKKMTFLVIFIFTVCIFFWHHQCKQRSIFRVLESEINIHSYVHYTILNRSKIQEK